MLACTFPVFSQQPSGSKEFTKEITANANGSFSIRESRKDGSMLYSGSLSSKEPEMREGTFIFYGSRGNIIATGFYSNDFPSGEWCYFTEKGDTMQLLNYEHVYQHMKNNGQKPDDTLPAMDTGNEVFMVVEDMPVFRNGNAGEFRNFIFENLRYPVYASQKEIQGRVFVQFTVEKDGKVSNARIVRSAHPDLDAETLRVVMESPEWTPGRQRGQPVNVQFTFPVVFLLN